jgi:D-alanine-D-alanine ligase
MLDKASGEIFVNEINTIPGSFAFYLYEPMGLKFRQLIDKLVEYAYLAAEEKQKSSFAFESEILSKAMRGGKMNKLK